LLRKLWIDVTDPDDDWTEKLEDFHDLPAEPVELDESSNIWSQMPTIDGALRDTEGSNAEVGDVILTEAEEVVFHFEQSALDGQVALTFPPRTLA
jgi:hypothetical protein